jgi:hypothetical protein
MKTLSIALLAIPMLATTAFAQDAAGPAPKMRLGAQVEILPLGTLEASAGGQSSSTDADIAYGIGATFDYDITPNFSIGAAPRFIFNVNGKDSNDDAGKQLDLRVRATAHFPVAPQIQIYGFVAPGYSIVMLPSGAGIDDPKGFAIGFGGGLTYDVAPKVFLSGEVGYQLGFQSTKVLDQDLDAKTRYLSIGLGAGARF